VPVPDPVPSQFSWSGRRPLRTLVGSVKQNGDRTVDQSPVEYGFQAAKLKPYPGTRMPWRPPSSTPAATRDSSNRPRRCLPCANVGAVGRPGAHHYESLSRLSGAAGTFDCCSIHRPVLSSGGLAVPHQIRMSGYAGRLAGVECPHQHCSVPLRDM